MMLKLGFGEPWVKWVIMCVETINFSILVNHDRVGPVVLLRGLRQGYPLSP